MSSFLTSLIYGIKRKFNPKDHPVLNTIDDITPEIIEGIANNSIKSLTINYDTNFVDLEEDKNISPYAKKV